jgi:hypothetical protein
MDHTLYIVSASFSGRTADRSSIRAVCISAKEAEEMVERLTRGEEEDRFQDFAVTYLVEEIHTADVSGKPTIPIYIVTANFDDADGMRYDHYARFICGIKNSLMEGENLIKVLKEDEEDSFQNKAFAEVLNWKLEYNLFAIKTDHTGLVITH